MTNFDLSSFSESDLLTAQQIQPRFFELCLARSMKQVDELKDLLNRYPAASHMTTGLGVTALMIAASSDHDQALELLIPHSNLLAKESHGWNAFMCAARNRSTLSILKRLSQACPTDCLDHAGCNALMLSLQPASHAERLEEQVRFLLHLHPEFANHMNLKGSSALLMSAGAARQSAIIEQLIPFMSSQAINTFNTHGVTPLFKALVNNRQDNAKLLIPVTDLSLKTTIEQIDADKLLTAREVAIHLHQDELVAMMDAYREFHELQRLPPAIDHPSPFKLRI